MSDRHGLHSHLSSLGFAYIRLVRKGLENCPSADKAVLLLEIRDVRKALEGWAALGQRRAPTLIAPANGRRFPILEVTRSSCASDANWGGSSQSDGHGRGAV